MLDDHTLAFADFRGNKQYISAGNVAGDDRTVLFLSGLSFANPARALRSRFASSSPMLIPNSSAPHRPRLRRPHRARVCV
jgi:predicted pyridoxine 5'-phosphate oxidase superfamily flavin-nucleotide-binding protein